MSRPAKTRSSRPPARKSRAEPSAVAGPQPRQRDAKRARNRKNASTANLAIAQEEEELCNRVVAHLRNLRPSQPPPRWDDDEALISLRDQIASARLEDIPALVAQMDQVQAVANRRAQRVVEPIDPSTPYFGHLRLEEQGRGTRDVLIGKTTYLEPRADIRIVDWRHAPVSQLYYRHDEGSHYEETFGDREVEGVVRVRRTVTIEHGKLERVAAPQGTFARGPRDEWLRHLAQPTVLSGGQGAALRPEHYAHLVANRLGPKARGAARRRGILGAGATAAQREDRHLPEISALLDPLQFEIITQPDSGLVVVQGGAGSGKTTIGVHRMAFLAYQRPERFSPNRMLVVVGTPALAAYISELLAALGLGEVEVVTFAGWARRTRRRLFSALRLPAEDNTPTMVSRYKTDPAVLRLLEQRAVEVRQEGGDDARAALWLWADVLTDREGIRQAFAERNSARLSPDEIERAWRYCSDRCPAVLEHVAEDESEHAAEERTAPADDDAQAEERDERAVLDPEDDALLLRAWQLVCGRPAGGRGGPRYEHLFVDEAQDLAPVDLAVLLELASEQRSVTLAGDTAQRLQIDTGFADWREVSGDLGLSPVAVEPLRIAYRSTRQVMVFARSVLGSLADAEPPVAPRSGAEVEHHHFPGPGAAAAFLAEALRPLFVREPRATVAVLARFPEQADAYYDALRMADVPKLRRVRHYDFSFRPGVEVTEIRQIKGLEYDYVILVDVNASSFPATDEARYQLHIGATRAAHQLWIISTGPPSPILPAKLRSPS